MLTRAAGRQTVSVNNTDKIEDGYGLVFADLELVRR